MRSRKSKSNLTKNVVRSSSRSSSEMAQVTGMNQKMQKQIIKDFRKGVHNILVATSIGEEGLDIGEVDLIVCFDSTGSPIKNIQRMGRTGRSRDGEIFLLFSSNEEQKFDKAMDAYEYIQQYVMKRDSIELAKQNRIIPKKFSPLIQKKYIEISQEHMNVKKEEDEDEVIRLAVSYMNKSSKRPKLNTKPNKNQKILKKFFMPDNVETKFQSVTNMLKKSSSEVPHASRGSIVSNGDNDSTIELLETSVKYKEQETNSLLHNLSNDHSKSITSHEDEESRNSGPSGTTDHDSNSVKRKNSSEEVPLVSKKLSLQNSSQLVLPSSRLSSEFEVDDSSSFENDVFDDGLDTELSLLLKHETESDPRFTYPYTRDEIYDCDFSGNRGLLNSEQELELYTSHYSTVDSSQRRRFYNPSDGIRKHEDTQLHNSTIGHSSATRSILSLERPSLSIDNLNIHKQMLKNNNFSSSCKKLYSYIVTSD